MAIKTAAEANAAMKHHIPVRVENKESRPRGRIVKVMSSLSSDVPDAIVVLLDNDHEVTVPPGQVSIDS